MLNVMVSIGKDFAIRADEVQRIDTGFRKTRITMSDGREYITSMSVNEVTVAVNLALNSTRAALKEHSNEA